MIMGAEAVLESARAKDYLENDQEAPMADFSKKRPPAAGASRGKKGGRRTASQGVTVHFATSMANIDFTKRGPVRRIARQMTIEDRLEAKADIADQRDYSGQRSLSDMSDDELIAFLSRV